jgi:integrase
MKNGKWRGSRTIQGIVKTKVFPTKQEARKWEALQSAELWLEQVPTTPTTSLLDFASAYLNIAHERHVRATYNEKRLAFKHLFKVVDSTAPPTSITPAIALECLRAVFKSTSGNSANVARKNLMAAWNWGRKYYNLPSPNPFEAVDQFPADEHPRYVPPEGDFWKVYETAPQRDRAMLLLMLHTGARRREVFRLRWEDVDLLGRKVRFGTRKTRHGGMEYAWVSMTTRLRDALDLHRSHSQSEHVFTQPVTGEPYTTRQHFMEKLCEKAGVKAFGFHAIRHLSATIMAYKGLEIPNIQSVLRHHNLNTTARYIKKLGVEPQRMDSIFS